MLAYLFERFPKFSQTFCYREIAELFRQGERPVIFSLRPGDKMGSREIAAAVHELPEGEEFAQAADAARDFLSRDGRKILRQWRGRRDSLRLHQAVYIGARLQKIGVSHLHAHFAGMAARTAFWINKFFGIPFSVTAHANDIFVPNDFEIGLREIFSAARAIVAVSDFAGNFLREEFPEVSGRIHRIYNGIDLAGYQTSTFPSPPLILSIGRLINKKGFDLLIDACVLLAGSDFRCEIIGGGLLQGELQIQIERNDLRDRVRLTGTQTPDEIARRLAETSIFVLPARIDPDGAMDNLPTVIMEAMAASVPVVSTLVGGIPEMVSDRQTGFLVATNDSRALADAIKELLGNQNLAQEIGARGRERCVELFDIEKNVRALRRIFRL